MVTISAGLAVLDPHQFRPARDVLKEQTNSSTERSGSVANRIELAASLPLLKPTLRILRV